MTMKLKALWLTLALAASLSLYGCESQEPEPTAEQRAAPAIQPTAAATVQLARPVDLTPLTTPAEPTTAPRPERQPESQPEQERQTVTRIGQSTAAGEETTAQAQEKVRGDVQTKKQAARLRTAQEADGSGYGRSATAASTRSWLSEHPEVKAALAELPCATQEDRPETHPLAGILKTAVAAKNGTGNQEQERAAMEPYLPLLEAPLLSEHFVYPYRNEPGTGCLTYRVAIKGLAQLQNKNDGTLARLIASTEPPAFMGLNHTGTAIAAGRIVNGMPATYGNQPGRLLNPSFVTEEEKRDDEGYRLAENIFTVQAAASEGDPNEGRKINSLEQTEMAIAMAAWILQQEVPKLTVLLLADQLPEHQGDGTRILTVLRSKEASDDFGASLAHAAVLSHFPDNQGWIPLGLAGLLEPGQVPRPDGAADAQKPIRNGTRLRALPPAGGLHRGRDPYGPGARSQRRDRTVPGDPGRSVLHQAVERTQRPETRADRRLRPPAGKVKGPGQPARPRRPGRGLPQAGQAGIQHGTNLGQQRDCGAEWTLTRRTGDGTTRRPT